MTECLELPEAGEADRRAQQLLGTTVDCARRLLRATGDPFPLLRLQWPSAVLDSFQEDLLRSIFNPRIREVYCKGCTASGKTAAVAMAICLWFDAFPDARVVLTSSTFDHVRSVLFYEVSRWFRSMRHPTDGAELQAEGIAHSEDRYVVCANPAHGESFSGRHGRHAMFVFDEATGVPDERFGLADTQATKFVALANPRTLSGRFRLAFAPCADPNRTETVLGPYGNRRCITVDGEDVLNVRNCRLEHPVAPIGGIRIGDRTFEQGEHIPDAYYEHARPIVEGQLCLDTYLAHCANPDHRWAGVFAHGRFPEEDAQVQVILSSWIDRHVAAWQQKKPEVTCFALDPADSEFGDETILVAGGPEGCRAIHARRHEGLMQTCAWVLEACRTQYGIDLTAGDCTIVVDAGGLGRGVASRLAELGVKVLAVEGGESAENKARYVNRRAELYGVLGDRISPVGNWSATPWALPPDSLLRQDLCAPEKIYDSDGFRYKITPKTRQAGMPANRATLHEKLGRSPDRGDAVALLYWAVFRGATAPLAAVSRYQLATAVVLDGQAGQDNRGANAVIAAVAQDPRYGTTAMVVLGIIVPEASYVLLRCEAWSTASEEQIAANIYAIGQTHRAWGIAIFPAHSMALGQRLANMGAPVHATALGAPERQRIARSLVDAFRQKSVRLYKTPELIDQIARLPIEHKIDGPMLGDPATDAAPIARGLAFALAMHWAAGTLRELSAR